MPWPGRSTRLLDLAIMSQARKLPTSTLIQPARKYSFHTVRPYRAGSGCGTPKVPAQQGSVSCPNSGFRHSTSPLGRGSLQHLLQSTLQP